MIIVKHYFGRNCWEGRNSASRYFWNCASGGAPFDQEPERQWDKGRVTDRGGGKSMGEGRVPICEGEMGRLQTYPRQQRAPGGGNIAALADRKWQNKYKWRLIKVILLVKENKSHIFSCFIPSWSVEMRDLRFENMDTGLIFQNCEPIFKNGLNIIFS